MLDEKVCVVTGSARGIGRATALEMARRGARVVVSDVSSQGGPETVAEIEAAGGEAIFIKCDLTDGDQVRGLMSGAAERFGGIDVLHNNAGIHEAELHGTNTIDTLPDDVWEKVFDVNVRGVWWAIKAAVPYLAKSQRNPSIINAASTGALLGFPNAAAYCSSKAAVANLTRAAAVDLFDRGIRCNCYCPGTTKTPMIERFIEAGAGDPGVMSGLVSAQLHDEIGQPEEIAKLVCFLASDDATFVNGAVWVIDGGKLAWRGTRPS
jgi:NAD(P)-dependent dehydrogenase (short-subunit alcohol dehydrogenase family)